MQVEAERASVVEATSEAVAASEAVATTKTVETTWRPDGSVTVTETARAEVVRTVEVERIVYRDREVERLVYVDRARTEERQLSQWRAGAELGLDLGGRRIPIPGIPPGVPVVAGVSVERRIVGPVWAGAWASTGYAAGIRLAVEF